MRSINRLLRWMRSTRPPTPWPDHAQTCPKCHRPLPGAFAPGSMGRVVPSRWPATASGELQMLCPIDGRLGARLSPRRRTDDELREAANRLCQRLREAGDRSWAELFETAAARPASEFRILFGH